MQVLEPEFLKFACVFCHWYGCLDDMHYETDTLLCDRCWRRQQIARQWEARHG